MAKAPERGSFPLDHFHECDTQAKSYSQCVLKHQLIPKRCRKFQVAYLQCRMNSGLMEKEEMTDLGFNDGNSWETEESQRRQIYNTIQKFKNEAKAKVKAKAEREGKKLPQDWD